MGTETENLLPETITFRAACRENTGRQICDSGGAYGRWHEKEEIDPESPLCSMEFYGWSEDGTPEEGRYGPRGEISTTLHAGAFLDEVGEIDRELQAKFESFAANRDDPREPWEDALQAFMEEEYPGWECASRGNTYNEESDLDQCFTWWVFVNPEEVSDWIFADDGEYVTILRMHTGCDVRGGYGRPLFVTERFSKGGEGYPIPIDHVCEWYFQPVEPEPEETSLLPGMPEPDDAGEIFSERWNGSGYGTRGYSGYPTGEAMKFITRCFPDTYHDGAVDVEVTFRERGAYDIEPGDGSADDMTARVRLHLDSPYC